MLFKQLRNFLNFDCLFFFFSSAANAGAQSFNAGGGGGGGLGASCKLWYNSKKFIEFQENSKRADW